MKTLRIISAVFAVCSIALMLFLGFDVKLFICAIVCVYAYLWSSSVCQKRSSNKNATQATSIAGSVEAEKYTFIHFRVAGVTFNNDDNSSRQAILRHIKFGDEPFASEDGKITAQITETEFNGNLAYKVFLNGYQVGFVPKESIRDVSEAMEYDDCNVSAVDIIGGGKNEEGERMPYGCEIYVKYR